MEQQQEMRESHVQQLPDEMLADVLRRLAPRGLAASRCVCKAWRTAIDAHALLRPELLPLSLGGIFVEFYMLLLPEFLSSSSVSGDLSYTATPRTRIIDHCNGLLLRSRYVVVNPATRQWAALPPRPHTNAAGEAFCADAYLVFDPAVSPHYEVLLLPFALAPTAAGSEWPPPSCETHAFSSRTGRWEARSFAREGEPAETVAAMALGFGIGRHYGGVYWRGALYVHCQDHVICKVSVAEGKYRVITPPVKKNDVPRHFGKSEKGVYFAALDCHLRRLRVWILDDGGSGSSSGGQMEWVLKHQCNNLQQVLASQDSYHQQDDDGACWSFKDINHYADIAEYPVPEDYDDEEEEEEEEEEEGEPAKLNHSYITLLGFHPFKEIVYLNSNYFSRGLAYDLNTCKIQDLGNMYPKYYDSLAGPQGYIRASFPYTPCWMENSLPSST